MWHNYSKANKESVLKLATYLTFIIGRLDYQHGQKELTLAKAVVVPLQLDVNWNRIKIDLLPPIIDDHYHINSSDEVRVRTKLTTFYIPYNVRCWQSNNHQSKIMIWSIQPFQMLYAGLYSMYHNKKMYILLVDTWKARARIIPHYCACA